MDKYAVLRRIGVGTYGSAYLVCVKDAPGLQYVLKKLRLDDTVGEKEREAAENEVAVLATFNHPFVLGYVDSYIYKSHLCIITSYCEAGDLYTFLKKQEQRLPEVQVLDWFVQMVLAVQHIHDRKILHRDLKTQNVFLKEGNVCIGDFGIAKVMKTMELAMTVVGTPYYMSPEIMESKPYDFKSDIWALGCMLYEMCTLKHAFDATDMSSLVLKILRGTTMPLPPEYSPELQQLVNQLLSKSPQKRPSLGHILDLPFLQDSVVRVQGQLEQLMTRQVMGGATSWGAESESEPSTVSDSDRGNLLAGDLDLEVRQGRTSDAARYDAPGPSLPVGARGRRRRTVGAAPPGEPADTSHASHAPDGSSAQYAGSAQRGPELEMDPAVAAARQRLRLIQSERENVRRQVHQLEASLGSGDTLRRDRAGLPPMPRGGEPGMESPSYDMDGSPARGGTIPVHYGGPSPTQNGSSTGGDASDGKPPMGRTRGAAAGRRLTYGGPSSGAEPGPGSVHRSPAQAHAQRGHDASPLRASGGLLPDIGGERDSSTVEEALERHRLHRHNTGIGMRTGRRRSKSLGHYDELVGGDGGSPPGHGHGDQSLAAPDPHPGTLAGDGGMRARRAAKKAEDMRRHEEELLQARRRYFVERKAAAAKNRKLYAVSSALVGTQGQDDAPHYARSASVHPHGALESSDDEYDGRHEPRHRRPPGLAALQVDALHGDAMREFEGELARPGPGLPSLHSPTFTQGEVQDRIAALRQLCIENLGDKMFNSVRQFLRQHNNRRSSASGDPGGLGDQALREQLRETLGEDKVHYFVLIDKLLYYEDCASSGR